MTERIIENFDRHASTIPDQTGSMQVFQSPALTYVDSGLPCDTFNVLHVKNGANLSEAELAHALNYYRDRHLPFCVWISEENLTHDLLSHFKNEGLTQQNREPGMALDLSAYSIANNALHAHAAIITTPEQLSDYAHVIAANWTPLDKNVMAYFKLAETSLLDKHNNILLAAFYQDDKPVSVLEIFPTDGQTAGLYGLATLADYRGKGIGSALLTFALNKVKTLGFRHIALQASEDGLGIYKRLGFKIYTTYHEFA